MKLSKLLPKLMRHQGASLLSSRQIPVARQWCCVCVVTEQFLAPGQTQLPMACPKMLSTLLGSPGTDGNGCRLKHPLALLGDVPKLSPGVFARCLVGAGAAQSCGCRTGVTGQNFHPAFLCSFNKHAGNADCKFFSAWPCLVCFVS